MDQVPYYIIDLLQQSPSVDIRGLGRFEAIFHPAVVEANASRIKPPFMRADFVEADVAQHGLLSRYISYTSGASPAMADRAIDDFVSRVHAETTADHQFAIREFGTFARTESNALRFTPDWDAFNLAFRGLDIIDLQERKPEPTPVEPETTTPTYTSWQPEKATPVDSGDTVVESEPRINLVPEIKPVETTSRPGIEESTSRLWWIILVSALFLITVLCGYLAWDILSNRQKLDGYTLATVPDTTSVAQPGNDPQVVDSIAIEVNPLPTDTQVLPVEAEKPADTPVKPAPVTPQPDGNYCYVVVGAFADPKNIERMELRLTELGYTSTQLKGRTMTRVAIRTSCEKDSLNSVLNAARTSVNPEAWIY